MGRIGGTGRIGRFVQADPGPSCPSQPDLPMLKVALTGGIATGKSYVLEQFRRRGVPCLDADELAHGVTAAGTEATAAIAARFGAEVLAADGAVDRAKLGPIVFADAGGAPRARSDRAPGRLSRDRGGPARRSSCSGDAARGRRRAAAVRDRRARRASTA